MTELKEYTSEAVCISGNPKSNGNTTFMLICILTIFISLPCTAQTNADVQAANAVNAFAIDVYRQLAADGGNLFFSPYSISSALAMTYAGARGRTAAEIEKTLHFADFKSKIHPQMSNVQNRFAAISSKANAFDTANSRYGRGFGVVNSRGTGALNIANRLWLDNREVLKADYKTLIEKHYGAGFDTVDFFNAPEKARLKINGWVAQKTNDRIKDLLLPRNVNSDMRLILTNTIYFNSAWSMPFREINTKNEPFHTGKDRQKTVPIMSQWMFLSYGENAVMQWLKIPYDIPGFSMLILLPKENRSFTQLAELEKKITPQAMASWMADMKSSPIILRMPKFKDVQRYSLADILKKLGMKTAFTGSADFSGMVENAVVNGNALMISYVIHKAFIEVDEKGTEAAAATAVGGLMGGRTKPIEWIAFDADHPFIYCIIDEQTGVILFMGRMIEP